MPFTILLAVFAVLGLAVIFGITYRIRGVRAASITTLIALVVAALLYVAIIFAITRSM